MNPISGAIRTPDQRLRIFVSSTLKELAAERRAARTAIERLHLAPVMFELGARPHPPRELYRAYLEQSDIFLGLYWERYGWVAPGEDVSGLEDEYRLATALPKLIYIKEPRNPREPRLDELLDRIRSDDTASFKYFSDAKELGQLLVSDLATLLAERFDQSRLSLQEAPAPVPAPSPAAPIAPTSGPLSPLTALIGREREVEAVVGMLEGEAARLVTLTGPGGIGKSRLSIEVANRLRDHYPGGVFFVDLAPIRDPALVTAAIAQALGVRDTGDEPLDAKLAMALRGRHMLLVLDNLEQVVDAAPTLVALLASQPGLSFLVTSRTLLRVTVERSFEVGPLRVPDLARPWSPADALALPSVQLFVQRVRAFKPDFDLNAENVDSVVRICVALEGVPLAIELAAARARVLTPLSILERLDRQLPLLVGGLRDLPERQRTVRSTIEWSTQLLGEKEKDLLARLGVFSGSFSLEAVEYLADGSPDSDALMVLGTLVDSSLVRQHDRGPRSSFSMLATVREYAQEQLSAKGLLDSARDRHAEYYVGLGATAERYLKGPSQLEWVTRLTDERENLRAAVRHLLDRKDWDTAAPFAWSLYIYWWVGGHLGEVRGWMEEVLAAKEPLTDLTRAIALYFTRAITFWQDPDNRVIPGLTESAELFRKAGVPSGQALALVSLALAQLTTSTPDPVQAEDALETSLDVFRDAGDHWGEGMALVTLGRVSLMQQKVQGALNRFTESLAETRLQHDQLGVTIALHHLGWARLLLGDVDSAREAFDESLQASARLGHDEGVAYGLESLVAIAATQGDVERAGRLLGASQRLREQTGLYNAPSFSFYQQMVDQILATDAAESFERARREGRQMSPADAVAYAAGVRA